MKKIIFVLVYLVLNIISVNAQTYCYRLLHSVNNQGVKSKTAHTYRYVTFINNKSLCYTSDEYGNNKNTAFSDAGVCEYKGKSNGNHLYVEPNHQVLQNFNDIFGDTYIFSSDFSRMNYKTKTFKDLILVYERVSEPKNEEAPIELY